MIPVSLRLHWGVADNRDTCAFVANLLTLLNPGFKSVLTHRLTELGIRVVKLPSQAREYMIGYYEESNFSVIFGCTVLLVSQNIHSCFDTLEETWLGQNWRWVDSDFSLLRLKNWISIHKIQFLWLVWAGQSACEGFSCDSQKGNVKAWPHAACCCCRNVTMSLWAICRSWWWWLLSFNLLVLNYHVYLLYVFRFLIAWCLWWFFCFWVMY